MKRIAKINLNPDEEKIVRFEIGRQALSFFDPVKKTWIAEPGKFEILIGISFKDIELIEKFKLK